MCRIEAVSIKAAAKRPMQPVRSDYNPKE